MREVLGRSVPAVVAICWLGVTSLACSSGAKSAAPSADASRPRNGGPGDSAPDEGTAQSSEGDDAAAEDARADTRVTPFDGGFHGPECTSSGDCPLGDICCAEVGGLLAKTTCATRDSCGGAEACRESSSTDCKSGACRQYVCTFSGSHLESTVYACSEPIVAGAACAEAYDAGMEDGG